MELGGFLLTLFGAIVGGAIASVTAFLVQKEQAKQAQNLQAESLRHQAEGQERAWRHERQREARRFQIDTLADLQETLSELVKRAHKAGDEQSRLIDAVPKSGPDAGKVTLTDVWREYRTQYWETRSRVIVLVVRVGDESVRTMVNDLIHNTDRLGKDSLYSTNLIREMRKDGDDMGPDPDREAPEILFRINRRIGELIRAEQAESN